VIFTAITAVLFSYIFFSYKEIIATGSLVMVNSLSVSQYYVNMVIMGFSVISVLILFFAHTGRNKKPKIHIYMIMFILFLYNYGLMMQYRISEAMPMEYSKSQVNNFFGSDKDTLVKIAFKKLKQERLKNFGKKGIKEIQDSNFAKFVLNEVADANSEKDTVLKNIKKSAYAAINSVVKDRFENGSYNLRKFWQNRSMLK